MQIGSYDLKILIHIHLYPLYNISCLAPYQNKNENISQTKYAQHNFVVDHEKCV